MTACYPSIRLIALTFFLLVAGSSFFAPEVVEADFFDDIGDAISAFVEVRIRKSLIFLPVMHFSFFSNSYLWPGSLFLLFPLFPQVVKAAVSVDELVRKNKVFSIP